VISVEFSTWAMRQSPILLFGKTVSPSSAAWACVGEAGHSPACLG
jgi:hypothetical protein